MHDVARALWLGRLWSGGMVLVLGLAATWAVGLPWGTISLLPAIGVAIGGGLATRRLAAAIRAGDRGEIMYTTGDLAPLARIHAAHVWDQLELILAAALLVAALLPAPLGGADRWAAALVAVMAAALLAVLGVQRRAGWRLLSAMLALQAHDPERTLEIVRPMLQRGGAYEGAALTYKVMALLQLGRVDQARDILEEQWTGALDASAVTLSLTRIGAGEPELADRWLATERPDDRYQRYLAALVRGHRALAADQAQAALAAARGGDALPPWYALDLTLIEAAALQRLGRGDEARAALAAVDLDQERWRAAVYPHLWTPLADAVAGRSSAAGAPPIPARAAARRGPAGPTDPFAPPAQDTPARHRGREVGALPAEWLPLGTRRARPVQWLLAGLSGLLLLLVAVLVPLVALLAATGRLTGAELTVYVTVVGFGVVFPAFVGTLLVGPTFVDGPAAAVRFADGRALRADARLTWWTWGVAPLLVGFVVPPLIVVAEVLGWGTTWTLLIAVPLVVLLIWHLNARLAALRLVRAVHFEAPEVALEAARRAESSRHPNAAAVRTWGGLAHLVAGDAPEAERVLAKAAHLVGQNRELLSWLRAGRGEVDLERLLARPDPDDEGARYRHAVTVALAALHAGAADRVVDRVPAWTALARRLPNRFGGLLHRANAAVLAASGRHDEAAAYRRAEPIDDGAWAAQVWPTL